MTNKVEFRKAVGRWAGTAEVFDSAGAFLGNGTDARHVQRLDDGRIRIDVSFVGPFKHAGHYFIQPRDNHRLYQGPANIGYAETLSETLIDANAYWPVLGLSQRFFLMIVDDNLQLSLAQMSRGEHLMYVVVGQNDRVPEGASNPQPKLVSGTHYDFQRDPTSGRGEILLHRAGIWSGTMYALDENRMVKGQATYHEQISLSPTLNVTYEGGVFDPTIKSVGLKTNGWQAWVNSPCDFVGSYSLSGGRASSGTFYHQNSHLRYWQRETIALDGSKKAVVQHWYEGGKRVGTQYGVLHFQAA